MNKNNGQKQVSLAGVAKAQKQQKKQVNPSAHLFVNRSTNVKYALRLPLSIVSSSVSYEGSVLT